MDFLNYGNLNTFQFNILEVLTRLGLALLLTSFSSITFFFSYRLAKQSQTILYSGVILSLIVTTILMVLSENVFYALGLFAALSIIRFRTPIKNPHDIVHLFLCIAIGIACGAGALKIAILATIFISMAQFLYCTFLEERLNKSYILRLVFTNELNIKNLESIISKYDSKAQRINLAKFDEGTQESIFNLTQGSEEKHTQVYHELKSIEGIQTVSVIKVRENYL